MAPEVRLNGPENEPLGVVPIQEALRLAGEYDVDLHLHGEVKTQIRVNIIAEA